MTETDAEPEYIFQDLLITGCVFSIYSHMGPEPVLYYPLYPGMDYSKKIQGIEESNIARNLNKRTLLQVAVKSVSLLLSDYSFTENLEEDLRNTKILGVLPYPDMESVSLTYFTYYLSKEKGYYLPCTLSLLVQRAPTTFIYDNMGRLKKPIYEFADSLLTFIQENEIYTEMEGLKYYSQIVPQFVEFFEKIKNIQEMPLSPITKKRRIKILFTGLENTGKTSFLLTLNRRFSKLINLKPTDNLMHEPLNFLGTSILKWDIPGKKELREMILKKSEIYLFETDVLYYFIDVQNIRLKESCQFLMNIKKHLDKYDEETPIIFILTKFDQDLINDPQIIENVNKIKANFSNIMGKHPYEFFETSIFSIYTILSAFSYGIRQLSPNQELINHLLGSFIRENRIVSIHLLNESGIVIGANEISDPEFHEVLSRKQIFEITASQFTSIEYHFQKIAEKEDKAKFILSESDLVLLKRFQVEDFIFFLLIYTKYPNEEEKIEKNIPELLSQLKSLLKLYC